MLPSTRFPPWAWRALVAAVLAPPTLGLAAPAGAEHAATLAEAFEAAWARQPEALSLAARRDAAQAQRRAARAWTPEPPALEASHRTDRLTGNDGSRELAVGVAVPLWLPGERRGADGLAQAEAAALESRTEAARLRIAAAVRDAWWAWHRAAAELEIARGQLDLVRRLAADAARRARAGELARADLNQADAAVAASEAALALAEAGTAAARQQVLALSGRLPAADTATPRAEPEPAPETPPHPALAEWQDRAAVAERTAVLAATQTRANPELTLAATRDRGTGGERYGQTVTVGVRWPFGGGARVEGRLANARADAVEAQAQLALEQARLQAEREAARARLEAARVQQAATERRAALARETRGFFDKSFRLGETDLPTRLRVENDAAEAERQAARNRIELAAALSAWRQALGLLPR